MSQELLYTSAPNGLKPGSRGFCTVLSTQAMPAPLATAVEGLSGYRPIFPPSDERSPQNPIVYAHLKLQAAGRSWDVLSRIADYGLDYSGRPNKLAHHVIIDKSNEKLSAGPAALLAMPGFMRTEWQGEPKVVGLKPVTTEPEARDGVCVNWQEATGDAGWAGVIAESFLTNPDRLVILFYEPGQSVLPLFEEAISLLPPDKRWNVTFSTYFTGLLPGTTCNWRGIISGTKEANESKRFIDALRIDLNQPPPFPEQTGDLVEAARTGERPEVSSVSIQPDHLSEGVEGQDVNDVIFSELPNEEITFTPTPGAPPILGKRKQAAHDKAAVPPARNPIGRSKEIGVKKHRKVLLWCVAFLVLLGGTFVLRKIVSNRSTPAESLQEAKESDIKSTDELTAETNAFQSRTTQSDEEQNKETEKADLIVAVPTTSSLSERASENSPPSLVGQPLRIDASSEDNKPTNKVGSDSGGSEAVESSVYPKVNENGALTLCRFSFKNIREQPQYSHFYDLSLDSSTSGKSRFSAKFGRLPPEIRMFVPSWVSFKINKKMGLEHQNDKVLLKVEDLPKDKSNIGNLVAIIRLIIRDNGTYEYSLKPLSDVLPGVLSWCHFEIDEGGLRKSVYLRKPVHLAAGTRTIRNDHEWKTDLICSGAAMDQFLIRTLRVKVGSEIYRMDETSIVAAQTGTNSEYIFASSELLKTLPTYLTPKFELEESSIAIVPTERDKKLDFKIKCGSLFKEEEILKRAKTYRNDRFDNVNSNLISHFKTFREKHELKTVASREETTFSELRKAVEQPPHDFESTAKDLISKQYSELLGANSSKSQIPTDEIDGFVKQLAEIVGQYNAAKSLQRQLDNAQVISGQVSVNCCDVNGVDEKRELVVLSFDEGGQP